MVNANPSGREYKLVTFTSESRRDPAKVYALTIDAARACGYSDSLAFLRRCPTILKLSCNPDERQMLIDIGRVTGNLRHRMVTMVAMRNVYKMMGARVIKSELTLFHSGLITLTEQMGNGSPTTITKIKH